MKPICHAIILLACVSHPQLSFCDVFSIREHNDSHKETYGETTLLIKSQYKQGMGLPEQSVTIIRNGTKIGMIPFFGDELFVSPDNKYFLTLSNSGLCNIAYLVFDNEGNIIRISYQDTRLAKQRENEYPVLYHSMSITVAREWYNAKDPKVDFIINDGELIDVKINNPKNKRISLLDKYEYVEELIASDKLLAHGNVEINNPNKYKVYKIQFKYFDQYIKIAKNYLGLEGVGNKKDKTTIFLRCAVIGSIRESAKQKNDREDWSVLFFDKDRNIIESKQFSSGVGFNDNLSYTSKGLCLDSYPEDLLWIIGPMTEKDIIKKKPNQPGSPDGQPTCDP